MLCSQLLITNWLCGTIFADVPSLRGCEDLAKMEDEGGVLVAEEPVGDANNDKGGTG
jgi:hypothetical protein